MGILSALWGKLGKSVNKFLNFNEILNEEMDVLVKKAVAMRGIEEDVKVALESLERRSGKKRKREVDCWLRNVERKETQVEERAREVRENRYFWQWRLQKLVQKDVEEVTELFEQGMFPEGLLIDEDDDQSQDDSQQVLEVRPLGEFDENVSAVEYYEQVRLGTDGLTSLNQCQGVVEDNQVFEPSNPSKLRKYCSTDDDKSKKDIKRRNLRVPPFHLLNISSKVQCGTKGLAKPETEPETQEQKSSHWRISALDQVELQVERENNKEENNEERHDTCKLTVEEPTYHTKAFDKPANVNLKQAGKIKTMPTKTVQVQISSDHDNNVPPDDGYSWRKYGQKPILGSKYPRVYYRCNRKRGCLASKQVQRSDVDPTLLEVTYRGEHTCSLPSQSVPQSPKICLNPDQSVQQISPPGNDSTPTMLKRTVQVLVSSDYDNNVPPDDGYIWRKYGKKDILGSKYPRLFYKCIHGNTLGCIARKQVQRSDVDPTLLDVTYHNVHTCSHPNQSVPQSPKICLSPDQSVQQISPPGNDSTSAQTCPYPDGYMDLPGNSYSISQPGISVDREEDLWDWDDLWESKS